MRKRTASDKISYVKQVKSPQSLRNLILKMFHDGFTVHEISETLGGHCTQIADIICAEIRKDAEQCL